ncbi:PspA/IM30 family protein [Geobacillus sp. TFV-3]|uniref:PspA/IM30 family protein n=1 Tax=Geobacillus sp. TFV-3 TaxID=1897059 RepID=UPI0013594FBC|nr:hypothetical protein [Geobacillus sp. TFV-3]KAF0993788.1 hypothetical protein BJQ97_00413 [Geobacillus sp. TFV-3]
MKKTRAFLLIALVALAGFSVFHVLAPHEVMAHGRPDVPFDGMHGGFGHHRPEFGMGPRRGWMMMGMLMKFIPLLLAGTGAVWLAAKPSKRWIGWTLVALGVAAIFPKWVLILLALAPFSADGALRGFARMEERVIALEAEASAARFGTNAVLSPVPLDEEVEREFAKWKDAQAKNA